MNAPIEQNGKRITVRFPHRPTKQIIRDMREAGFSWSPSKRAWMGDYSEEAEKVATVLLYKVCQVSEGLITENGINTILRGDCRDVLKSMPGNSFDLVVTDPPYLVRYKERSGRSIKGDRYGDWLQPAMAETARVMKPGGLMLSFYGWQCVDRFMEAWRVAGLRPVGHLVGHKGYASSNGFFDHVHEQAYLLAKGDAEPPEPKARLEDVRRWRYTGNKIHPTQKPTRILQDVIECFCPKGGVVLDPFAGSGSTCIAAAQAGRHFVGIELDERYHEAAEQRIRNFLKTGRDKAA